YNLISALHKSVRGSDPDAALYYLARMMEAGEDRRFIGRRLVVMASEDIGNADPQALTLAMSAVQAFDFLGPEEGDRALAQACVYLASAPKSNAVHVAIKKAKHAARENGSLLPPRHILNAPTKLMREEGYGEGYRYDHDEPDGFSGQAFFPEGMARETYYNPVERGFEREIRKRLEYWERLRKERAK
ncbi:MAG: replication-associated recombination protein A, partial [Pseudomonadota bacterium]